MATFIRSTVTEKDEWTHHKNRPVNIELVQEIVQKKLTVLSEDSHPEYRIEFRFVSGNESFWYYSEEQISERDFDYNYIMYNKFKK